MPHPPLLHPPWQWVAFPAFILSVHWENWVSEWESASQLYGHLLPQLKPGKFADCTSGGKPGRNGYWSSTIPHVTIKMAPPLMSGSRFQSCLGFCYHWTLQSVTSSPGSASVGGPQSPRTQTGCRLLDSVDCDFFLIQCGELPRVKWTVDVVHWSAFSTIKLLWSWFKDSPAMLGAVSYILEALYFFS